ncbi:MAG: TDT family transporter [Tissierellia bacterium]|nr:TDT family transporter [Tissierellia bacterium]
MGGIIKKLPIPIVGLMLGLAATGNLVLSYGDTYRNIFGCLSAILLLLVLIKIVMYPKEVKESLDNPVVASVFPTLSMGIMLLATYLKPYAGALAFGMWIIGLILHILLMIIFSKNYLVNFNIKKVFPSWFIVYVGIAVSSITSPAFNMTGVGQIAFWFGFISYLVLFPIVLYRVLKVKNIPEPALPTIVIFSAPASLCLTGYMNAFQEKNMAIVYLLLALSQATYIYILLTLPKLLKLKFYPSYSAFTFPLVISGIALKVTNGFLINAGHTIELLKYLVKLEEVVAVVMVLYVLFRYIGFLFSKEKVKG